MGASHDSYRIEVGGRGDAAVHDTLGNRVWTHQPGRPATDPEALCDALLEALSWTVQHHSGRLVVALTERRLANDLVSASTIDHHSRLSSMIDEARMLLTWFESTDVALCDADAHAA